MHRRSALQQSHLQAIGRLASRSSSLAVVIRTPLTLLVSISYSLSLFFLLDLVSHLLCHLVVFVTPVFSSMHLYLVSLLSRFASATLVAFCYSLSLLPQSLRCIAYPLSLLSLPSLALLTPVTFLSYHLHLLRCL